MFIITAVSNYSIPVIIFFIVIYGMLHKVPVYQTFIEGVKDGFKLVCDIAPTLIGLLVAVGIFRSSGGLDLFCMLFTPLTKLFSLSPEIFSIAFVRIFSSSAATGMVLDVFKTYGPDSVTGNIVSIMMSCTETVFYTMSVYFLAARVTKTRWTLPAALLSSVAGIIASILIA